MTLVKLTTIAGARALYAARFCLATLAPCLPKAVRVALER